MAATMGEKGAPAVDISIVDSIPYVNVAAVIEREDAVMPCGAVEGDAACHVTVKLELSWLEYEVPWDVAPGWELYTAMTCEGPVVACAVEVTTESVI